MCLFKVFLIVSSLLHTSTSIPPANTLETFVSRPDIHPLRLNVTRYDSAKISAGYWFLAFYHEEMDESVKRLTQTRQDGPHIFDNDGHLVWSGASLFPRRMTSDFRLSTIGGAQYLSLILNVAPTKLMLPPLYDRISIDFESGTNVILNDSYGVWRTVDTSRENQGLDIHEFNIVNNGSTALAIVLTSDFYHTVEGDNIGTSGHVTYNTVKELDVNTGFPAFEWNSKDHIPVSEVYRKPPVDWSQEVGSWDYLRLNSIDKTPSGDYLVSGRYSSTIYRISGKDGHMIWRFGGQSSSFVHENGFTFMAQHDARFLSENDTTTVISLFDNGGDELMNVKDTSSGLVVALETSTEPMTARVLNKYTRPDGKATRLRGNLQILEGGNAFLCWSRDAYISEPTPDGKCVMEARLVTGGTATYRGYKFKFTGAPDLSELALMSITYGTSDTHITAHYVSWNGATEVASWKFYGSNSSTHALAGEESSHRLLGNTGRKGFETTFVSQGRTEFAAVEALDKFGASLGRSSFHEVEVKESTSIEHLLQDDATERQPKDTPDTISMPGCDGRGSSGLMSPFFVSIPWLIIVMALAIYSFRGPRVKDTESAYTLVASGEESDS